MRKILTFITIFLFSLNNFAYSQNLNNYFKLSKINCNENDIFENFVQCLEKSLTKQAKYKNSLEYRVDATSFLDINFVYSDLVKEKIINNNEAYNSYNYLVNSDNSNIAKIDIERTILSSKCLDKNEFSQFINCFNEEFRSYPIYQKNSLLNKSKFEEMMFNIMMNNKGSLIVFIDIDGKEIKFERENGFKYFELMLERISKNYFINDAGLIMPDQEVIVMVDKSEQIRNALILIVAIIAISYVASKVVPKAIDKLTASSGSSSTSSSSVSSSVTSSPSSGKFMPNLFRHAPKNSILRQTHFKRLLVSGRLGF